MHHTKHKGDIATAKTILDLTQKGYVVFAPVICENARFDLIAYKDSKCYRIQCKYSILGIANNKTNWADKNGTHSKTYSKEDFDYYAVYLPEIDKVCYPSTDFIGIKIRHQVPKSATPFWWYEDFLEFTDSAEKKTYKDFGYEITRDFFTREGTRKVQRPSKEELEKLIWEFPMTTLSKKFGVSDNAIRKWAQSYGIKTPHQGYWLKKCAKRNSNPRPEV